MTEDPRDAKIRELEARVAELEARATHEQATEEAERNRQWLDNILRSIQDDFYVIDREWNFTYASALFTGKIGKQPNDFVGRNLWELFPKHLGTVYEENLRAAMERREVRRFEVTGKYTNAVYRMTVFPSVEGITVIGTDVTAQKAAELALRESQAALKAFYDSSPFMMGIVELQGDKLVAVYGNPAVARFFERAQHTIQDTLTASLGSPEQIDRIWVEHYRRCESQAAPVKFEYLHPRGEESRWISATVSFLGHSSSGSPRFSFVAEDVTDQRNAAEALARSEEAASAQAKELDAIIEAIGEGLNITDGQGNLLRVNRAGVRLFGYRGPDDYRHQLPSFTESWCVETVDGQPIPFDQWPTTRAVRGETFSDAEHTIRSLDGSSKLTLSHSGTAIRNDRGEIVRAIVTYRDITGLVEARQRLNAANAQLVEMDHRKNEFMAMLSHELRNPLAPIKNCLAILEQAAPSSEQAQRAKQTLNRQVNQLVRLVDDLLDMTRISRGKIELQRELLDVNELVQRTLDDHRSLFEQAMVRLEFVACASAVWVSADPNRMAQAIGNLLQNAAKFTPSGGLVTVEVTVAMDVNQVVVSVCDTGIGMQPEVLSRLFQAFVQADASIDRSRGGLGLGLALVKGLVELHGGSVEASSEGTHRGSKVALRLALEDCPAHVSRVSSFLPPAMCQRVLIIEDNADAADSLCELLELERHEVVVAYDGPTGIEKLRELRPSVVLCDIGLPGMNGYEVARAIRAEAIPLLCLVALSGYSLKEDVQRAKEAGFDQHLAKPPSLSQLKALFAALPSITQP